MIIKDNEFYINSKPTKIYSGAMHYFRMLPEYWEDRLVKLKLAGFNCVETYVCWNLHEKKPGEFDFSGRLDLIRYIETAKKVGLYCIVRPGPYICAEWDFGGLPAWMLKDKNIQIRCMNKGYLECVERFYNKLLPMLVPHLDTHGGNIIAMQVENEYGSYGNDKEYLKFIEDLMRKNGIDTLYFTSDGNWKNMISGGSLPHIYKVLNFGSKAKTAFNCLEEFGENGPNMCGEFWCGWFDHWRDKHHTRDAKSVEKEVAEFLEAGASFNFYMFHGGTNFEFTAGANHNQGKGYEPTTTSYDYCALLNEYGDYTPAYHAVRKLLCEKQNIEMTKLPPSPTLQTLGDVELTEFAPLFDNLDNIARKERVAVPESMEYFGQNNGLILYDTTIEGKYDMSFVDIKGVHDFGYVYIDGQLKKIIDRTKYSKPSMFIGKLLNMKYGGKFLMGPVDGKRKISVLVDSMGRINYGEHMIDRKGIEDIYIANQRQMGYDVYLMPLDNLDKLEYTNKKDSLPVFMKGTFKASSKEDTFVHLDGFTKGYVWVNGFNLGRYWSVGPQKSLYLPGALLKEENEIVILEMESFKDTKIKLLDKHILG